MELLTGFGPPFNSTPGQPDQCYKDLNTGDIYKCCQAIDIHTPHFDQAAEYRWKLHIKGDEQADLAFSLFVTVQKLNEKVEELSKKSSEVT